MAMAKKWILLALAALAGQGAVCYPRMPSVMATHFDGTGRANGWMTVPVAIGFECAIVAVLLLAFVGLPRLLSRLDPSLINLPNKGHRLAPARRVSRRWRITSTASP